MPARISRAGPQPSVFRAEVAHLAAVEAAHPEHGLGQFSAATPNEAAEAHHLALSHDQIYGRGVGGEAKAAHLQHRLRVHRVGAGIHLVDGSPGHHPDHRIPFEVLDRQGADPSTVTKHREAIADGEDLLEAVRYIDNALCRPPASAGSDRTACRSPVW